ncbi:MAG: cupin domain-containing protein, partial [Ruminococcus sp.]|nr:cupin domain-containing protein [Ruminococcus sp.]
MIDFTKIKEVAIEQFNGGVGVTKANMFMDKNMKIMISTLEKDCSIGKHIHSTSSEVIYVLSGSARVILNGEEEIIKAGQCHYCPKGSTHEI